MLPARRSLILLYINKGGVEKKQKERKKRGTQSTPKKKRNAHVKEALVITVSIGSTSHKHTHVVLPKHRENYI
jgi:hypothetical protein